MNGKAAELAAINLPNCGRKVKSVETAIHELFHAYEYSLYPETYQCNEEETSRYHARHEGFATTMTWLYLKSQGLSYGIFDNHTNGSAEYQAYFHNFVNAVYQYKHPDGDVSEVEKRADVITVQDVYDYLAATQPEYCTVPGKGTGNNDGNGQGTGLESGGGTGSSSGGGDLEVVPMAVVVVQVHLQIRLHGADEIL